MSSTTTVFKGVVNGKTIELDHDLGLPDGQPVTVTVTVQPANGSQALAPGEGLRRSAGTGRKMPKSWTLTLSGPATIARDGVRNLSHELLDRYRHLFRTSKAEGHR